jgi:hypothetical protein
MDRKSLEGDMRCLNTGFRSRIELGTRPRGASTG